MLEFIIFKKTANFDSVVCKSQMVGESWLDVAPESALGGLSGFWRLQSISAETSDGKIQNPKTKSVTWLGNKFTNECREQITILNLILQI